MNNNITLLALKSDDAKFSIDTFKERCKVIEFDKEEDLIAAAKSKQGNAVISYHPNNELVNAVHPLSYLAVGLPTFKMPDGCIRKVPVKITFRMAESNLKAVEEEQSERGMMAAIPAPSIEKNVPVPVKPSVQVAVPVSSVTSKNDKKLKSRVCFPDSDKTPIPPGTKMVHINYNGVYAYGEIDADGLMVWNGNKYTSLTACSNDVTHAVFEFRGIERKTNATTTGTRNWFPEDTPENAAMRELCHKDRVKTIGVKWKPVALELAPEGPPKRGRSAKINAQLTTTVPVAAAVETTENEEDSEVF